MLIKYEFLKIVRKKSTLIVMAVSLLATAFLFGLPIKQYQSYNQDGVIQGLKGISYAKEEAEKYSVPLTDEYITETIREYQHLFENPDNRGYDGNEEYLIGDAYWNFVAPRTKLLNMIADNYDNLYENSGYKKLPNLDMTNGANFYQTREDKIELFLNDPYNKLSGEQKEYWRNMNSNVKNPMQYGYYEGWDIIVTCFELLMIALLAVCIVLAPVFSGEYQAGTDAVILSGKYGKTKLIKAKIIAAFLYGTLAFTLNIIVALGIPLLAFGTGGWNLPLQIANTIIPYPFTFLQATLINVLVIYMILFGMISLTLLLSAKMKSPYLVLLVLVPILFIPMFLSPKGITGIYNLIIFLLPYRATVPEVSKYISYQFGGLVFDTFLMRTIIYAMLTMITLPFAKIGFKKHQVS